jgi:hypothetical protein
VDFSAVEWQPEAFPRPVSPGQVTALLARTLGEDVPVARGVEIATGTYNNTYRVELIDREPVVLRVAPAPSLQHRRDHQAMRNEHAATPLLASSASAVVPDWPSTRRASFFRTLGAITRTVRYGGGPRLVPAHPPMDRERRCTGELWGVAPGPGRSDGRGAGPVRHV